MKVLKAPRYARCGCGGHAECRGCGAWIVSLADPPWADPPPEDAPAPTDIIGCSLCHRPATCSKCGQKKLTYPTVPA